jgi:hypothetical protein
MHASHLARRLAATLIPGVGGVGVALGKDDPYFALQANAACVLSYVRRAEIEGCKHIQLYLATDGRRGYPGVSKMRVAD